VIEKSRVQYVIIVESLFRMDVVDMIYYWARAVPDRPAIIQSEMVTTFQGLADGIESIGERVDRLNLNRREPVAVCVANPSFMLATIFALLRAGYSVAPVNVPLYPHLSGAGLRNLIYDTHGQVISSGRNIRFDMSWLPIPDSSGSRRFSHRVPAEPADLIFFTSGTTGLPKKVTQPAAALDRLLKYPFTSATGDHQKILVMPGLASTFGFNRVCEILNVGKTACFAQEGLAALSLIYVFGVEVVVGSAQQVLGLAKLRKSNPGFQLASLQTVIIGGGKIEPQGIASLSAALCRNVLSQYGSTEAGVVAMAPFSTIANIPDAIGVVLPWVEIEIVEETGKSLQPGSTGMIRYRTPQLLENINASGEQAVPGVRDGWFYPGDIGSVTAEGVLCLAGRSSDVINRGGVKVSGARIEEALKALPYIKDAAACGVAGPSGLEEIWVAIVASAMIDAEQIKAYLAMPDKIGVPPDEIFVLDELPRGELGKVQKYRLKELMLALKGSV
jgi:acyl-CoA synthetase (AMP-forming)/AMP-acid ligase II